MALIASFMATHYAAFRRWGLLGARSLRCLGSIVFWDATGKHYFGLAGQVSLFELPHWIKQAFAKDQGGLPIYGNLILVAIPFVFLFALLIYRHRGPVLNHAGALRHHAVVFRAVPLGSTATTGTTGSVTVWT